MIRLILSVAGLGAIIFLIFTLSTGVSGWTCQIQSYPEADSVMPSMNLKEKGSMCASLVGSCRHQDSCRLRQAGDAYYFLIGLNHSAVEWYDPNASGGGES